MSNSTSGKPSSTAANDDPQLDHTPHDHAHCLQDALSRAEQAFSEKGIKLTELRRLVFEEIAGSHDAVRAYDVLDRLSRKTGNRMAPISVYRALDALLEAGVVHRLESRNAFFACHVAHNDVAHGEHRQHIALICEGCGTVCEVDGTAVFASIDRATKAAAFSARTSVVEVTGACQPCRAQATKAS
jgi:Fur family zinc uptake transcriptional regulator